MYFKEKKYEMVLVAWEAKTKDVWQFEGGLGIRDPKINNKALSEKIWWNWC